MASPPSRASAFDHIFLGFTAPTGDGGQLADLQLEGDRQRRSPVPGTPT
jgi:hypothetical protein